MKATAERLEGNKVALSVEVDADRVEQALEQAYRKVVREVNVPGFRKGRVPRKVIEAKFGKEILYEEALEILLPEAYQEALKTTETEPIDQPELSDVEIEAGKPLRFRAEVDVIPEVELGEYKGIKVEKLVERVESKDIDHQLWHLQEENSELVSTDRDVVQDGDFVVIDFEGFIDGEPFQGGAGKGVTLEIGSGRFIEGFEEQLVGAKLGVEHEVKTTFPDDYPADELKGKEALFKVTVDSIKVKQVPQIDDDFARDFGDAETLLELRSKIRTEMEEAASKRAENEMRDRLLAEVNERCSVDLPDVLVNRELDHVLNDFVQTLVLQGISPQAFLDQTGKSVDDLRDDLRPQAEERVKTNLVLQAIAEAEGIEVSEEELEAKIQELVGESSNQDEAKSTWEDSDRRSSLKSSMVLEKVIEQLISWAEIEEKEIPSEGHGHHHHDDEDPSDEDENDDDAKAAKESDDDSAEEEVEGDEG